MFRSCDVTIENVTEVIRWCISIDDMSVFYLSQAWEKLRAEVMGDFKNECQPCKQRGFYRKASIVHHEKYVRLYPALALSKTFIDEQGKGQRQLTPVCTDCHRQIHSKDKDRAPGFTTEERWD